MSLWSIGHETKDLINKTSSLSTSSELCSDKSNGWILPLTGFMSGEFFLNAAELTYFILHLAPYTLHISFFTSHHTPYTVHFTHYTSNETLVQHQINS